jgi:NAD(P)-dependent dehydrogenase (short-subunit alcohol dehydrogenase family)
VRRGDLVTVQGDIGQIDTARRVVELGLDRFGRIDSLINNAGLYIGKSFTDYTPEDFAAAVAVNLARFFDITQLAIEKHGRSGPRPHRQRQHKPGRPRRQHQTVGTGVADQGWPGGRDPRTGH